jgi:hypothetical protein
VPPRTLTGRELNRALLGRQFLLERSTLSLTKTLERIGGLQSQYAPSAYIGLWSRLEGFALEDLTRALERRRAVQGTLMRTTIHIVSARDYPLFAAGTRRSRQEGWVTYHRKRIGKVDMPKLAERVRKALADGPRTRSELLELSPDASVWNGVGAWIDLVRAPPSGTWERRRADLYATAEDWLGVPSPSEEEGLDHLLRRYLEGFGPARLAEAADWAGVTPATLAPAAERLRLRRFQDEEGKELLGLPRAPLPAADSPAPPRFLPTWDATLLVHARRTQILPERFRPLVFSTKTPHSVSTFIIDGAVAGIWRAERTRSKATLVLEPFEGVPRGARRALKAEAERLLRFVEPEATSYSVSGV